MGISIPGRVVVFDYGEVISLSPTERSKAELLAIAGVPTEPFWESYWSHRDGLDRGTTSIVDYWKAVAADVAADWPASKLHELWVADFTSWFTPDTGTIDVLGELFEGGTRLALLSNAGFDFAGPFRFSPMGQYFEHLFVSAEMLMIKPSEEIYLEVATQLGITPAEMIFIDNKQVNVEGAEALGITGHVFTGAAGLREFLVSLSS